MSKRILSLSAACAVYCLNADEDTSKHKYWKQKNGLMQRVRWETTASDFWKHRRCAGMLNEYSASLQVSRFKGTETHVMPVNKTYF